MALILDGNGLIQGLSAGGLPDGSIDASSLASTLDLSSKTMTFGNVSASGITFPASATASGNPNTLDDYEEGTWTVIDSSGAGLTITNTTGTYVKIGRVVYITCFPTYPSTANGSIARLSLPFFVASEYSSLSKSYISGGNSQINWLPLAENGAAYFGFRAPDGGDTNATNANLSSKNIIVSGCYLT